MPPALPTNTRPPTDVAFALACRSPGKANAHLSFRRGTSSAVRPAFDVSCRRVFVRLTPQPFHDGPLKGFANRPGASAHIALAEGALLKPLSKVLSVTNSASARRSTAERPVAIEIIAPLSIAFRTRAGAICLKASRLGARAAPLSWHE